jgi:fermentation-respiration switch protein FrsA (DUF1100 family)
MLWMILLIPGFFLYSYWRDRRRIGLVKARRGLITQFAVLLVLYFATLGTLLVFEDRLLFQPISYEAILMQNPALHHESVTIPCSTGDTLEGWWCPNEKAMCTVLFCHGTGGNLSIHSQIVPMLQQSIPVNVLTFGYPGYSNSTGIPSEANCYAAAESAYHWLLSEKKIPAERLFILGQSLGGGVACDLAVKHPHAGLMLLSTFTSLPASAQEVLPIFPVKWLMKNQFNNQEKLACYQGPLLIAHGTEDVVVAFHLSEKLFAAACSTNKRFCPMPGGTHTLVTQDFFKEFRSMVEKISVPSTNQ